MRVKGDLFSVGSGSTFAYGVLDTDYDFDMKVADACELGRRSIYHATHRDAYSGGSVNGLFRILCESRCSCLMLSLLGAAGRMEVYWQL